MVKVQREGDAWIVEVTFREPFEDFFEIAVHNARFAHPHDAHRLAERVRKAIQGAYPKSPASILDPEQWDYRSSAYDTRYHKLSTPYPVPASKAALEADARSD